MRIIGHLDMDAFFASVEERDNPRFHGQPIAVGADPKGGLGRGVVSTANYKARAYGIHSALPISAAWRFSEAAKRKDLPPVIFLDVNMEKYGEVSGRIMAILRKFAAHVEEASVDEAYLDLSFTGSYEKAKELCEKIKNEIKSKERLTSSVGIGPNKLIAKIASGKQKPDGFTVVREEDAENFLEPLPIRSIPGIGPKTEERFMASGAKLVKDIKKFSKEKLSEMLGKWGAELYEKVRAKDDSPITEEWEAKSIGEQETFESDTRDSNLLLGSLKRLCEGVYTQFIGSGFKSFRTVTITVRFSDFITKNRSITLEAATGDSDALIFTAIKSFMPFLDVRENPGKKAIRLIGVRIEKLE